MENYHRHPEWEDAKQDAEILYIEKNLDLCEVEKAKWIYVTAVNVIRNIIRKNSYVTTFSSVLQSSKCSVIDIDNLCGLCYQNIESKMTFEFLIETLDSEEKDFLSMFIHGYNYQDLADHFKITNNNARQRLFKIKNKLKTNLPPPPINLLVYTNFI
jgi:DNA-directed RNA polymerase specialized sigma24 family protein